MAQQYVCLVKISFKSFNDLNDASQFLRDLYLDFNGRIGWGAANFSSFICEVNLVDSPISKEYLQTLTFNMKVEAESDEALKTFMNRVTAHAESKIKRLYSNASQCLTDYGFLSWEDFYTTTIS